MTDGTPGRAGTWRLRVAAGLGLLLVLVAAGLVATVPRELAEKRTYVAAPACSEGTPSDTCTTTVPAAVVEKETGFRGNGRYLRIVEQGTNSVQRVRLVGQQQVYGSVHAADEVLLTYWRGKITAVKLGTAVQQTGESPTEGWRSPLGFGLLLLYLGLLLLVLILWSRYRSPSAQQPYSWSLGCLMMAGMLPGPVGLAVSRDGSDIPEVLLATAAAIPVGAVVGGLVVGWLRWRAKSVQDTSEVTPVVPAETKFVPAIVLGEVPYSQNFFDRLIVGDGRPAATPDRKGRVVVRKTLPETLTVEHVRAFRPDDPAHWPEAFKRNGVVIECRDGDHSVLIVARRRYAPLILGALASTSDTADADTGQPA